MAHQVRLAAVSDVPLDCSSLAVLLDAQLRQYLEGRLPAGIRFSVTVKQIRAGQDGKKRLVDLFRDESQRTQRPLGAEDLEKNYLYQRLVGSGGQGAKLVMVPDTEELDALYVGLRDRARARNYRSTLAFPMNFPSMFRAEPAEPSAEFTPLLGFLAIDSPVAHAFDDLFEDSGENRSTGSGGQNGRALTPKREMELFYGIVDSIATFVILNDRQRAQKTEGKTK